MSVSDSFNRVDAGDLGGNWAEITHGMQIIGAKAYGVVNFVYQWCYYSGVSWGNDHSSQATATVAGGTQMGVTVRTRNSSGNTGYVLMCSPAFRHLYRYDSGVGTLLQDYGGALANGDVLKLEAVGTTLKAYVNGLQIGTDQTDATYATGGAPGIFMLGDAAGGDALDSWVGTGEGVTGTATSTGSGTAATGRCLRGVRGGLLRGLAE